MRVTLPIVASLLGLVVAAGGCRGLNALGAADGGHDTEASGPVHLRCEVVARYPHDPNAFTQGLAFADGHLFEGTGLRGRSSVRRVDLESGEVLQSVALDSDLFGEGITLVGTRLYQLTWQAGRALVYDATTFAPVETFTYDTEGWGLAYDGRRLVMSDGSDTIRFRDPTTFEVLGAIKVHDGNTPVDQLNELEVIDGDIYANVWQTNEIVRISPDTGEVLAWIDLAELSVGHSAAERRDVLNGIAWDSAGERLFVTGKLWADLYEIRLVPR
jgi:glutamine cyclotransferase